MLCVRVKASIESVAIKVENRHPILPSLPKVFLFSRFDRSDNRSLAR